MKLKAVSGIMLTLLVASMLIVLTSPIPAIAQTDSTTTVYLDPPTINGAVIGQEFSVSIMIRDAPDIQGWQAGMTFDSDLLNCTGFFEGEFLSDWGSTLCYHEGTIDNTAGVITIYAYSLVGKIYASGDGRLAYATFRVKAPGVSDLHLRDVKLSCWKIVDTTPVKVKIPTNIIDVYTVILDTTAHAVVTVSNSTDATPAYGSGFYGHSFSIPDKEISFTITGPRPGFSNVTIPKALLSVGTLEEWAVIVDDLSVSRSITESATHTSIYFTYTAGIHKVQIFGTHAPPPSYTLTIYGSPTGVTFAVDSVSRATPWSGTYSEGSSVSLVMPETYAGYVWSHWLEDGDPNRIKTVTMDTDITLTAVYTEVPKPVGGKATPINIPVNKPETPALWMWLATIILAVSVSVAYIKYRKKQ